MNSIDQMPLPPWATSLSQGSLVPGVQLITKSPRRMGNAHILEIAEDFSTGSNPVFTLITDAGNTFRLTREEVLSSFEIGDYISSIANIKKHFLRESDEDVRNRSELLGSFQKALVTIDEIAGDLNEQNQANFCESLALEQDGALTRIYEITQKVLK